eukprot:1719914-Prymnesium_polylepis.1
MLGLRVLPCARDRTATAARGTVCPPRVWPARAPRCARGHAMPWNVGVLVNCDVPAKRLFRSKTRPNGAAPFAAPR